MRVWELAGEAINGLSDNTLYFLYKNVEFNPSLFVIYYKSWNVHCNCNTKEL